MRAFGSEKRMSFCPAHSNSDAADADLPPHPVAGVVVPTYMAHHQGMTLVALTNAGTAQAFERQFSVPYPSLADTDGTAIAALQGTVPVNAVPTTVVLDRSGNVAGRILGLADPSTLRSMVDGLLAEPAPIP